MRKFSVGRIDDWPMIGHAPWNGCNLADYVNGLLSVSTCDGLIAIPLALKVSSPFYFVSF